MTSTATGASTLSGSCGGNGSERVYRWQPTFSGTWGITTCTGDLLTNFSNVIYVRQGNCQTGPELTCGFSNSFFCQTGGVIRARATVNVVAGQTYYIIVDGVSGGGFFELSVFVPEP